MRRAAVVLLIAVAALVAAGRAFAAPCGLPDAQPWWIDFSDGSVSFRNEVFGRPGIIAATEGGAVAASLRARGATTIYWNMNLFRQVGTNVVPAPAGDVVAAADRLFDAAAAGSVCATPLIALNELLGQRSPPPWSPQTSLYRANVLAVLDELKKRGARPFLLLTNSQPNFDGDSFLWWQRVAQDADLVREIYFNAPAISAQGPLLASRTLRMGLRDAARPLLRIGMPPAHVGLMLGFHAGTVSGRVGLQPREAWLDYVKLNALAVQQVVRELHIGSVWSWGWGTFGPGSADPDKPAAACVYLWTRDAKLCDGPSVAGPSFDASLTEGQITLPAGVQCSFGSARIQAKAISAASALAHDPLLGFGAIFTRALQRARASVTSAEILRAERGIVRSRFGGETARYRAALQLRGIALDTARGVIGDELRRNKLIPLVGGNVKGWTEAAQKAALGTAICLGDQLPPVGDVRLASYATFLALARA